MKIDNLLTVDGVRYYLLFFHIGVHITYFTISENLKTYINIIIFNTVRRITFNNLKIVAKIYKIYKIYCCRHVPIVPSYKYATYSLKQLKIQCRKIKMMLCTLCICPYDLTINRSQLKNKIKIKKN
jgi:hypothetical protein